MENQSSKFYLQLILVILCTLLHYGNADLAISPNDAQCGGTVMDLDQGTLNYPPVTGPIPGITCIWAIHLKTKTQFQFNITEFNIIGRDEDCSGASLAVYSLSNIFSQGYQGRVLCNENYPTSQYFEDGHTVVLILRTDAYTSTSTRFRISWEGKQELSNPPSHSSTFTTTPSGIVRYPLDEEYPPNSVLTWIIQPATIAVDARLSITDVDLEGCMFSDPCLCDAIYIYEVTEEGRIVVADKFCGERTEDEVLINGNKFIAVFYSDIMDDPGVGLGFQMIWRSGETATSTPTTTTTSTTTTRTTTVTTPYTTTEDPDPVIITECGGMIHANIGKIIYKPDEKYGNSERCAWIIRSPYFNNTLYMTKTRSGFELGKDYLSVHGFDTSDSESTTIGRTTNDIESRTMRRTVAVVVFTSDAGGEDGTGFELEFKFNGTALYGVETYFDSFSSEVSGLVKVGGAEPGDNYGRNALSVFVMTRNNTYYTDIGWESNLHIFKMNDGLLCAYDNVRVYSVTLDSLNFVGRYCSNSDSTFGPFLATNCFIFVQRSDSTLNEGGFEIYWNERNLLESNEDKYILS